MLLFPRCTPKQLCWILILICFTVIINIVYLNHVTGYTTIVMKFTNDIISDAHANLALTLSNTRNVLFWDGFHNIKDQDVKCFAPNDNCVFQVRTKTDESFPFTIIFNEDILNSTEKPTTRRDDQLYVFWSTTPSDKAPACSISNDNFFNWSFTYRLDSTVIWNNFVVQHSVSRNIVAPNSSVIWEPNHGPIKSYVRNILKNKTKPLAWIVSDCKSNNSDCSWSRLYMADLKQQMADLDLPIDLFNKSNGSEDDENLDNMVNQKYYFVIAFEDYFDKDYVSNKVLRAYDNYAVPVVYGGANYSWFLPPNSYLNAKEMDPYNLAYAIKQALGNAELYASFFNWTNVYSISAYPEGKHPLCSLCSALNEERKISANFVPSSADDKYYPSAIRFFRQWWNTPTTKKLCDDLFLREMKSWLLAQ